METSKFHKKTLRWNSKLHFPLNCTQNNYI